MNITSLFPSQLIYISGCFKPFKWRNYEAIENTMQDLGTEENKSSSGCNLEF